MASASGSSGKFVPPKWCKAPMDPKLRKQVLRLDSLGGGVAVREVPVLAKAVCTLGRADAGVDVQLRGALASRLHAAICQDPEGRKYLVDLRSTHGTFLGGRRLNPHEPVRWTADVKASFGSGDKAEVAELSAPGEGEATPNGNGVTLEELAGKASAGNGEEEDQPLAKKAKTAPPSDAFDLYGDLPQAMVTKIAPVVQERRYIEPIPPPVEPTIIVFLDIDGVLRSVHGRTDFAKNMKTMNVDGKRVALMGDGNNDNLAGIDFWPGALRSLAHIVQKSGAGVCLSSDWRKDDKLIEGINNQLTEYHMPKLYDQTPDLDKKNVAGVVKAIHSNLREKRAKEIRRWLKQHPKVESWVAIDDMDLSASRKDEILHQQTGGMEPMPFLDPLANFVKCNPAVGLTMELSKLVVALLAGRAVTPEDIEWANMPPGSHDAVQDPSFQGMGPTVLLG